MTIIKRKVFAYITHGNRLLVFSHPDHPEAGIQVPAGSIKEGERLGAAVLREAFEETGLDGLELVAFLGEQRRDMADFGLGQIHLRHFYHLRCNGNPPETWRHYERDPSEGGSGPIAFDFFWAPLPDDVPALIADQDAMLPRLLETVGDGDGFSGGNRLKPALQTS
ncbi:MAG TPA: NUDIX domain-containing protein [Anaerolineae bacterium]